MRIPRKKKDTSRRVPERVKSDRKGKPNSEKLKPVFKVVRITIDGPVSSGKSALARKLAKRVQGVHLNSGLIYRCLAYAALQDGLVVSQVEEILRICPTLKFHLDLTAENKSVLRCNGRVVGNEVEEEDIAQFASMIAVFPEIRALLTKVQRDLLQPYSRFVLEGRDAGTVVIPDAQLKFFIECDIKDRVFMCRHRLSQRTGKQYSEDVVREMILSRDTRDIEREHDPLKIAEDGIKLVNRVNGSNAVLREMSELVYRKLGGNEVPF